MKNTPIRKIFSIIIKIGLIVMTIAAIGFYFVHSLRSQDTARAKPLAQSAISEPENLQENIQISEEVLESSEQEREESAFEVQTQTIGEVTVEVTYVKKIETGLEIGVCFTTLDDGEWYPGSGYLVYGEEKMPPDEAGLIREVHADGKNTGIRCLNIRYRIDEPDKITLPIQFTMRDVYMIPREMPACQNLQHRLDTSPKAQAYGITVDCTEGKEQGEMSVELAGFSSSYSKEEAQMILDEIVSGKVSGPWEFTINDIEPTANPQANSVLMNEIRISVTNYRIENERLFVDVCFDRPDNSDWVIHEANIKIGNESFSLTGTNLIQVREIPVDGKQEVSDLNSFRIEESDGSDKGLRCDTLYFNINPKSDFSEITLEIPVIYANPREGEECLPAQIEKFQKALDARVKGIQIQCNNEIYEEGGGASGIVVIHKPDSLTDAALDELMTDQSLYNEAFGIYGPWIFTGSLSDDISDPPVSTTVAVENSMQVAEVPSFEVQTQTIGDVTVEVTYTKQIESGLEIGVCFTTLDDGEWYPGPGYLVYGEEKMPPDEAGLIREVHADGKNTGIRCLNIRYRIDEPDKIALPIQFTMRDVYMTPLQKGQLT